MADMTLGDTQDIIAECMERDLLRNQAAYVLATALWETAHTMKPVVEAYWLSEDWRANNLHYYPWHGRGYVQLTWEENYARAQDELALGTILTDNPDNALDPEYAKQIIVLGMLEGWFTGKKLSDYITLERSDFVDARRIVNGTDKAAEIAEIAVDYDNELLAMGYGVEEEAPDTPPPPPELPEFNLGALREILNGLASENEMLEDRVAALEAAIQDRCAPERT